ncbi:MAG: NADH-quinone oxidoreductase subunit [Bryobacterales bacterium]|jgi:NAD(P)H-quinone oxidoreductase subunit 5|nr:NADH-quinone oxidoreductase subunit [Bryobacterales bacterium]
MNFLSVVTPELLLVCTVLAPGIVFLVVAAAWLVGWKPAEKTFARITNGTFAFSALMFAALLLRMFQGGLTSLSAGKGNWYEVHTFRIPLTLFVDRLSVPLVALTVVLCGMVGVFARRYLHRDPGFYRFFLLLHLFAFAALLVFTAASFDLLIGGWELICVTSVLLIAFFQQRPAPAKNSIRVFATYRACDVGLILGAFLLHHATGSTLYESVFSGSWPTQGSAVQGGLATAIGCLLLFAAMGKSAQVPFSGWMPRAMEGPTPSSAIFYGAISVHVGAYLLLRSQPILAASPVASAVVVAVGVCSALHGTLVARACTDAKTSLAYSSVSQLGLIVAEIGFGFSWLALAHIAGHAIVRTLQFLKAPSALHEFHGMHAAAGGHLAPTGSHYERLLPAKAQSWLYRLAFDRGHLDTVIDRFFAGALTRFAVRMTSLEVRWAHTRTMAGVLRSERRFND